MTKYVCVEWPEYQIFMEHPRFEDDCYYCPDSSVYFIPEDLYDEVIEERMFPAEQDINLGHLTINKDSVTLSTTDETITFVYGYTRIPRNTRVLFYSPDKGYWISKSTVTVFGSMPGIYENGEMPGIDCEIVGIERNG